jgi:hypothetical protein
MKGFATPSPLRRRRQTAAAVIAAAVLALVAAACSGSSPSSAVSGDSPRAAGSSSSPSAVAYSACVRSHGVPNFPDPDSGGGIPKVDALHLGVSASQLQAAQQACESVYPNNGGSLSVSLRQCEETGDCPQAVVQQVMTQLRKFSQCMRSHGVPKWPDPTIDSQGRPAVVIYPWKLGVDPDSNQVNTEMDECRRVERPEVPTPIVEYLPPNGEGG